MINNTKKGSIGIAQINTIAGAIELNAKKIVENIRKAEDLGLDLVIFPENTLLGFPLEDTISRHPFLVDENIKWLKEIARIATKITALVGFLEPIEYDYKQAKKYYSSIAILQNGEIKDVVRKSVIPEFSIFNDLKILEPAKEVGLTKSKLLIVNGTKYAITVGEDFLNNKEFFNDKTLYSIDPIAELAKENPDVFINCASIPTNAKNESMKQNILSFIAKKYSKPVVFVNQVGAVDKTSFDGTSRVFNKNGELLARAKSYEEDFLIVNPQENIGKINDIPCGLEKAAEDLVSFSLDYENDLERTYKIAIQGIRDYFGKNGFKRAVIGLSGGLDSTVCAVLLADALGSENIFGVSMPSKITSSESKTDAELLANNLGINFTEAPIKDMVTTTNSCLQDLFKKVEGNWDNRYKQSFTMDNIQARSRAMFLWGISNEFGSCLPIATSDKSELYMGYATINGDMSGGYAPIADITKTKLFALARWLNKNREVKNAIPESIILKRPGAELAIDPKTGKPLCAEDALMPYEFLDEVIWRIENRHEHYFDMLDSEFVYEKKNNISKEQKTEWLEKFFRRMGTGLYKWHILPPSVVIDSKNINKYDYRQPITSSRINYKGTSVEEIQNKIAQF